MHGFSIVGADEGRSDSRPVDAKEIACTIRQLAIGAGRILNRRDTKIVDVIMLHRRCMKLLREDWGPRPAEIDRWLRSLHHAAEAKLLSGIGAGAGLFVGRSGAHLEEDRSLMDLDLGA